MRYVTLAAFAAMAATMAYFEWATAVLFACLLCYTLLCDWVAATRHQDRCQWNAYRVLDSMGAGCKDPGEWVKPIPLTLATEGGDS